MTKKKSNKILLHTRPGAPPEILPGRKDERIQALTVHEIQKEITVDRPLPKEAISRYLATVCLSEVLIAETSEGKRRWVETLMRVIQIEGRMSGEELKKRVKKMDGFSELAEVIDAAEVYSAQGDPPAPDSVDSTDAPSNGHKRA